MCISTVPAAGPGTNFEKPCPPHLKAGNNTKDPPNPVTGEPRNTPGPTPG